MLRALLPLLLGAALSAAAVLLARHWLAGELQPSSAAPALRAADGADDLPDPVRPAASSANQQPVDELAQLARESPSIALTRVASLEGFERADAVATLAREFARTDPVRALEQIAELRGSLAIELRDAMLEQWALADPAALLAYLTSIESTRELMTLFNRFPRWAQTLGAVAPELVLESAHLLPTRARVELEPLAMRALAETEPARAAALTAATADRTLRDKFAISIGGIVGAHDPDLALEWLESMEAPHWNAISNVIEGISQTDLARAVEVVLTTPWGERAQTVMFSSGNAGLTSAQALPIVERIAAAADHPSARTMMSSVIRAWAEHDLDAALRWVLANEQRLVDAQQASPPIGAPLQLAVRNLNQDWNLLGVLAAVARQGDVATAISQAAKLPPERRGEWIQPLISNEASRNPERALSLLEPYRGEPFFDAAFREVVMRTATMGSPAQAAAMLDREPPQTRDALVPTVAQRWAESDPQAARRWVMTLPQGAQRDRGIGAVLAGRASAGVFEESLLSEFSDSVAMQRSLVAVVVALGRTQPDAARRIIEQHIVDPAIRAQATSVLERSATLPR